MTNILLIRRMMEPQTKPASSPQYAPSRFPTFSTGDFRCSCSRPPLPGSCSLFCFCMDELCGYRAWTSNPWGISLPVVRIHLPYVPGEPKDRLRSRTCHDRLSRRSGPLSIHGSGRKSPDTRAESATRNGKPVERRHKVKTLAGTRRRSSVLVIAQLCGSV